MTKVGGQCLYTANCLRDIGQDRPYGRPRQEQARKSSYGCHDERTSDQSQKGRSWVRPSEIGHCCRSNVGDQISPGPGMQLGREI